MNVRIAAMLAALSIAAAGAQPISVSTRLKPGEVLSLTVKRSREDSRVAQRGVFITPVKASVLESGPDGAVVDWIPGDPSADPPEVLSNPLVRASMATLAGIHFEVKLSPEGEYRGLRNDEDVQLKLKAAVDGMIDQISAKLTNEATRAQFKTTANRMLSPRNLLNSATRDIQLYFSLGGGEFDRRKPLRLPVNSANPLGGAAIKSEIEYSVQAFSEQQGTARLHMVQTFDPTALKESLSRLMPAPPAAPPPGQATQELPAFVFQDEADYVVDLERGLARSIDHKRIIDASPAVRRLDSTIITLHSIRP
jgi:hypothetical protein